MHVHVCVLFLFLFVPCHAHSVALDSLLCFFFLLFAHNSHVMMTLQHYICWTMHACDMANLGQTIQLNLSYSYYELQLSAQ